MTETSSEDAPNGAAGPESPDGTTSPDDPDTPDAKLLRALTEFKEDLQERVRGMVRAKKASEQLCRDGAIENLDLVQKYTDWLRDVDLEPIGMEERRQKAVDSLDTYVQRQRSRRRMEFMQKLHRRAADRDLAVEKLAESPPTMFVDSFVVEPDFDGGRVAINYAREKVAETDLDPEAVLERRRELADRRDEATLPPEVFFERLRLAYRLAREARDRGPGERVDLVDLLGPLSLLNSETADWRDPELSEIDPYPKPRLAYQLQRLRRHGALEREGTRIDLGTATGGTTDDKEGVLFIPSGPGEGQYYLSIRFVDESSDG